jgi:hypothetical protein
VASTTCAPRIRYSMRFTVFSTVDSFDGAALKGVQDGRRLVKRLSEG